MHGKGEKSYIIDEMYDEIQELFESGEINRLLRLNGVRRRDWDDFRQEIAVILLSTPKEKVQDLTKFTMGVIKRQYHSRKSSWFLTFRAWDEQRAGLADAYGQVSDEGAEGNMVYGFGEGESYVQGVEEAGRKRADHLPPGGGAWHNSGSRPKAQGTPQHRHQDLQQDKKQDRR